MNLDDIELPSNRKFGYFFSVVFGVAAMYFFAIDSLIWSAVFGVLAVLFVLITVAKADLLLPLNKLWMRFGLLLGMIISPIVLGLIFFALFTPIAIMMRLFGRDELRLKVKEQRSHWLQRKTEINSESFLNQF
jgi:hypothetical protein